MACRQTIYAQKIRGELIIQLGNKCVSCGESDTAKLELDHCYGRPYTPNKLSYCQRLIRYRNEAKLGLIRLLCADCNKAARVRGENGAHVRTEHAELVERTQEFEVEI